MGLKLLVALLTPFATIPAMAQRLPSEKQIDARVASAMAQHDVKGLSVAVIERGNVKYVNSWGIRNAKNAPLTRDTIMYGASITKAVFAYTVMQLVDEGRINLDTSIATYLPKPLPEYSQEEDRYAAWQHLAGDERWRKLTPRILLTHGSGFSNFGFLEPDGKLKFHFEPGSRYAYSGDGIILLQFVLERGLGLDMGAEMQRRVFDRFGMKNTSMVWRADFANNLADGWMVDGIVEPHDERSATRASGSMDTTIADIAKFAAGYARGDGLSKAAHAEISKPQMAISTASQFPTLQAELSPVGRLPGLAAGLGVITFKGPQGSGLFKGGHNDSTANMMVCLKRKKRCVILLSNDVRAEPLFPEIVELVLGKTGMPWQWEYGAQVWAR